MRKLFFVLSAIVFIAFNSYGQSPKSQRMVLCEEFTQSSCYFCGLFNPAYDRLLKANNTNVISLKYQINWPGTDLMNLQNPTQVATRVAYYSVTGVPNTVEDGNIYNGSPDSSSFTQSYIDDEDTVTSPFAISLSHTLSSNYDTAYVKCIITCTAASIFGGTLQAYIVMTEDSINFATAPGTDGEKVFYNVMKEMYPNDAGATLPLSWTVGQTDTILIAATIPSYLYDIHKMSFVAFIQDNSDKNVKQAAYDAPIAVNTSSNSVITSINNVPAIQCSNAPFTPSVTLKNNSSTDTTFTATIIYIIDNDTIYTQVWNGVLLPGATINVDLPTITPTPGIHSISAYKIPYFGSQISAYLTIKYFIESDIVYPPLSQNFESSTNLPSNWILDSPTNENWLITSTASAFGNGYNAAYYPGPQYSSGSIGYMYISPINFSGLSVVELSFAVAYADYILNGTTYSNKLEVQLSTDCGSSWTSLYSKSGSTLSTAPAVTYNSSTGAYAFIPNNTQWRNELVDLDTAAGQTDVLIRFKVTNNWGDFLYVDNVYVASDAGINVMNLNNNVIVSPNPFNSDAKIAFNLNQSDNVYLRVMNVLGQKVYESDQGKLDSGNHTIKLNGENLTSGIYFVNLTIGNKSITKKVSVTH